MHDAATHDSAAPLAFMANKDTASNGDSMDKSATTNHSSLSESQNADVHLAVEPPQCSTQNGKKRSPFKCAVGVCAALAAFLAAGTFLWHYIHQSPYVDLSQSCIENAVKYELAANGCLDKLNSFTFEKQANCFFDLQAVDNSEYEVHITGTLQRLNYGVANQKIQFDKSTTTTIAQRFLRNIDDAAYVYFNYVMAFSVEKYRIKSTFDTVVMNTLKLVAPQIANSNRISEICNLANRYLNDIHPLSAVTYDAKKVYHWLHTNNDIGLLREIYLKFAMVTDNDSNQYKLLKCAHIPNTSVTWHWFNGIQEGLLDGDPFQFFMKIVVYIALAQYYSLHEIRDNHVYYALLFIAGNFDPNTGGARCDIQYPLWKVYKCNPEKNYKDFVNGIVGGVQIYATYVLPESAQ